jgi:hypothetical protein
MRCGNAVILPLALAAALVHTAADASSGARPAAELPVAGTAAHPAILLELGSAPLAVAAPALFAVVGTPGEHEGDSAIHVGADEVTSLRAGNGVWAIAFRFLLPPGHPSGDYTFWARWRQGGDPRVSSQTFEVWAGPATNRLDKRGTMVLPASGWTYAWHDGKTVTVKPDDAVIEIRNRGNGQAAKVFWGFLLGDPRPAPAPVELPAAVTNRPVVILGFGRTPLNRGTNDAAMRVLTGTIADRSTNVLFASIGGNAATVTHKGFGEWGAAFQFDLSPAIPAGFYSFHARYMSGGEPSQVLQTFTVKAGPDAQHLGVRGSFQTRNRTPFQLQWLAGKGTLAIFPGDRVLRIENAGKAHDAKVFEGFVLSGESHMPAWMTAERAVRRSAFLARVVGAERPERWLFVADGEGPGDEALFAGLAAEADRAGCRRTDVRYRLGTESDDLARSLNLPGRPAVVLVDPADRKVLGVLTQPRDAAQVAAFLSAPSTAGVLPSYPAVAQPGPATLKNGVPAEWLVATGWPGQCGVGRWGLDAEAQQRPNPGDYYVYAYYTAGNRWGFWTNRVPDSQGVCIVTERLADSFAWGRCTSYAVTYLQAAAASQCVLHLQHSGVASAVYLDGVERPLAEDTAPPIVLPRLAAAATGTVARPGQETHDDASVPQAAQPSLATALNLEPGWHCLVIKMVHAQGAGERVLFTARLTGEAVAGLRAQTCDPTAALGVARAAAGLWPRLTLEGVPGNLPRPGEPLTLVAEMRATPTRLPGFDGLYLPFPATLRVRLSDYDGREIRTVSTNGVFPTVARFDLGPAPAPGYYALTPELVAADGRLIRRFHPDGFSVVRDSTAQKARVDRKKLMNSWYYAFNDWETFAPWLERIGMYRNVGSVPGAPKDAAAKWQDASARGIVLTADFAGDSSWLNNATNEAQNVVALASAHTRHFKSVNEIDGRWGGEEGVAWNRTRHPETWVARTRWQYEAVHQVRPDALCFGGSLYCSGVGRQRTDHPEILGPRAWFRRCLELGLDNYVDAWDVHAYPQFPPKLEAPSVSNSPHESDLGVIEVMTELGKTNTKPFLLGETSALAWHGLAGLRWQADTLAKMTAWVNSRPDWLGLALCAAHHNRRETGEEYALAHDPGEAAAYTAGALIDGLPYQRVPADDPDVQVARFGETLMAWRADERTSAYDLALPGNGPWLIVDVVGRARPFAVRDGRAVVTIGTSPVYVLTRAEYERLTR